MVGAKFLRLRTSEKKRRTFCVALFTSAIIMRNAVRLEAMPDNDAALRRADARASHFPTAASGDSPNA
jgi:hypothetical protein